MTEDRSRRGVPEALAWVVWGWRAPYWRWRRRRLLDRWCRQGPREPRP